MNGYTKADNWLWDYVMPKAKPNTFKVVSAVVRATAGWHRSEAELTFDDLQEMTGIAGRNTLSRAIDDAIGEGFVTRKESGRTYVYSTNTVPIDGTKTEPTEPESVPEQNQQQYQNGTSDSNEMVPPTSGALKERERKQQNQTLDSHFAEAIAAYQDNISMTYGPMIADDIGEAVDKYPDGWVVDAIKVAAKADARNWRYIEAVLENWQREGRKELGRAGKNGSGPHVQTINDESGGAFV